MFKRQHLGLFIRWNLSAHKWPNYFGNFWLLLKWGQDGTRSTLGRSKTCTAEYRTNPCLIPLQFVSVSMDYLMINGFPV